MAGPDLAAPLLLNDLRTVRPRDSYDGEIRDRGGRRTSTDVTGLGKTSVSRPVSRGRRDLPSRDLTPHLPFWTPVIPGTPLSHILGPVSRGLFPGFVTSSPKRGTLLSQDSSVVSDPRPSGRTGLEHSVSQSAAGPRGGRTTNVGRHTMSMSRVHEDRERPTP